MYIIFKFFLKAAKDMTVCTATLTNTGHRKLKYQVLGLTVAEAGG
jgi:hypothetical protein